MEIRKNINLLAWAAAVMLVLAPLSAHAKTAEPRDSSTVRVTFSKAVKRVAPSVVSIYAAKVVRNRMAEDPRYQQLLGSDAQKRVERSLGSGVIVGESGVVVTNLHVIEGASAITVGLADGREFPAKLAGSDEKLDIAVLKIEVPRGANLPVAQFGDSDTLDVGDVVLALGNPFGIGQSVSFGVVSAVDRTNANLSAYGQFIQTDAAINPGNSGGALIDSTGALVGINTAIFTKSGGSQGISFATPANLVKTVVNDIVRTGRVVRPWLGAEGQSLTPQVAARLGLNDSRGVLLTDVIPGSPASAAGLQKGDVIVRIAGRDVTDPASLNDKIMATPNLLDKPTGLVIWRGGKLQEVLATLTALPPRRTESQLTVQGYNPLAGVVLEPLSPSLNVELGLALSTTGVAVIKAPAKAPLAAFNLVAQPGDLLLSINGAAINTPADAQRALDAERRAWELRYQRQGKVYKVVLQ